jgi:hypothetical protein
MYTSKLIANRIELNSSMNCAKGFEAGLDNVVVKGVIAILNGVVSKKKGRLTTPLLFFY